MRRIVTKNWKVIAYIIGYVVLIVAELDTLNTVYVGVGMAWLVLWLLRNNDTSRDGDFDINGDLMDSRNMHGSYYRDY
ncbi:hypothetical protein [Tritonibacter mobilis]|uniref:hypothetical protein n=1 Tax=Tritonibacter mobilis TaxID=379347 RepID=UPI0008068B00|nr:hypothetical protein [Tritonibacter mobilis]